MNIQSDQQLLQDYARSHSEAAFVELVRRHVDLVHSTALRMVCDAHQAEDVTQSVFVALAQGAGQLTQHPVLSGWLHRTTQNLAANAVRTNIRRQTREQEAVAMNELLATEVNTSWERIAPLLDTALGELSEPDRDALLLRYFESKSAREMAKTLGISDEAAQKRVNRAVERLRDLFAKRGVTVGASGLVLLITTNAVQAAPAGLTAAACCAATAKTAISTAKLIAVTKTIAMTTLQKAILTTTITVLSGAGIYEVHQVQHRAQLLAQVQAVPRSLPRTTQATGLIKGQLFTLAQLVDAGNTTPEAAWESRYWARSKGDYEAFIAATDPQTLKDPKNFWWGDKATFPDGSREEFSSFKEFQMLARKDLDNDRVELKYQFTFLNRKSPQETKIALMVRDNGVWRIQQTRPYVTNWDAGSQAEPQP